jgi:hypothetical protein
MLFCFLCTSNLFHHNRLWMETYIAIITKMITNIYMTQVYTYYRNTMFILSLFTLSPHNMFRPLGPSGESQNIEFIFQEDFLPNGSIVLVFYNKLLQFFYLWSRMWTWYVPSKRRFSLAALEDSWSPYRWRKQTLGALVSRWNWL